MCFRVCIIYNSNLLQSKIKFFVFGLYIYPSKNIIPLKQYYFAKTNVKFFFPYEIKALSVHLHVIHGFGYGGDTVSCATHNRPVIDCPGRTEKTCTKNARDSASWNLVRI